ncbi:MAG: FAD:protein FMN transferase [Planctomycetota bacterium]
MGQLSAGKEMTAGDDYTPAIDSNSDSISGLQRFSHNAMATVFEIFVLHPDALYARQAAYAAFEELDKLEAELSRFIENSDISRLNNHPPNQPLRISLEAFETLWLSAKISAETNGAFDVTIGALMECWLNEDKTMRMPFKARLSEARRHTGMNLIKLNKDDYTVRRLTDKVKIDLGGFGKGFAVDKMTDILRDWDIDTALIHGGASSVFALGAPPEKKGWPVTISSPTNRQKILAHLHLQNNALSGSGLRKGAHIIDPCTAKPVKDIIAAWSLASTAATADALSTAFMIMSPNQIARYCTNHPDVAAMTITSPSSKEEKIRIFGYWKENKPLTQN